MKPRKTRIVKIRQRGGNIVYKAQHKRFLWLWRDWFDDSDCLFEPFHPKSAWIESINSTVSPDIERVKKLIDNYITMFNREMQVRDDSKVVEVEYIDYP